MMSFQFCLSFSIVLVSFRFLFGSGRKSCTLLVKQLRVQTGRKPNSILMAHLGMQEHGQQHNDGPFISAFPY